jgi:TATA-box binding protein (TBP) (component of TFIID and TFIIIB)
MRALLLAAAVPALAGAAIPAVSLDTPRAVHTATLLPSGEVLVIGGCTVDSCELDARGATTELFDPRTNTFRTGPRLSMPRDGHAAAVLRGGGVLVLGGWTPAGATATAERFDGTRFAGTGRMRVARGAPTATTLRDGRVLVTGGESRDNRKLRSAELYDPRTGRFAPTGSMRSPRGAHVAVLLRDGRVLVIGGTDGDLVLATTELYDPKRGRFTPGPRLRLARQKHAAVVLRDGRVLVLGGSDERDFAGRFASAELLDVRRARSARVAPMTARRYKLPDAAVLLADGSVLVAGGAPELERFDPRHNRFVPAGRIDASLAFSTATRLRDGRVLVAGGYDERIDVSARAWIVTTP